MHLINILMRRMQSMILCGGMVLIIFVLLRCVQNTLCAICSIRFHVCKIHCVQFARSVFVCTKYTVCSLLIRESVCKLWCVQVTQWVCRLPTPIFLFQNGYLAKCSNGKLKVPNNEIIKGLETQCSEYFCTYRNIKMRNIWMNMLSAFQN